MSDALLWGLPLIPLLGALINGSLGRRLGERLVGVVGVGAVALPFALAVGLLALGADGALVHELGPWFEAGGLTTRFALRLDGLSTVFVLVTTGVGALIHLHATGYVRGEPDVHRFFAWMNLFVASMLVLVLADDLLFLFLGWEGVGLCSYLLIGFWYRDPANGAAARKAFVVTRLGDVALLLGTILIFSELGTVQFEAIDKLAPLAWLSDPSTATLAAGLLLGGAVGKSAQVPLQVWLPDAMAGPTPVSALIHAATMVTAGVYLLLRLHGVFLLAPAVLDVVAVVGGASVVLGGFAALAQHDLKRMLAWSTVSQVGFMFLAIGVRAWDAAVFHVVTHAFIKAALFLSAGSILVALHHERDMRKMGGLWRRLPVVFATFLVGSLALSGFPLVTAGFYSKEAILEGVAHRSAGLWALGLAGTTLTGLYLFRAVRLVFTGAAATAPTRRPGAAGALALGALLGLSIVGGSLMLPDYLGGAAPLASLLEPRLTHEASASPAVPLGEIGLAGVATVATLLGIAAPWLVRAPGGAAAARLARFARGGFGFDTLYRQLLVRPYVELGDASRADPIDALFRGLAGVARALHGALSRTQDGRVRSELLGVAVGAGLLLALAIWGP